MIRLIAPSDMDGTLLDPELEVPPSSSKEAVQARRSLCGLSSGRRYDALRWLLGGRR